MTSLIGSELPEGEFLADLGQKAPEGAYPKFTIMGKVFDAAKPDEPTDSRPMIVHDGPGGFPSSGGSSGASFGGPGAMPGGLPGGGAWAGPSTGWPTRSGR